VSVTHSLAIEQCNLSAYGHTELDYLNCKLSCGMSTSGWPDTSNNIHYIFRKNNRCN